MGTIAELGIGIGDTPVETVMLHCRGIIRPVLLKCESHNPTGSVKDRTALGLVTAMHQARPLTPGSVVVESTSGNLGLALARLLRGLDCQLIVIVDPKTPQHTQAALARAGAQVRCVTEPDDYGGYLMTRLRTVERMCRANPDYRWSDQYHSTANPAVHRRTTGPEILAAGGPELDAVYAAVSTGGTLAGIAAHLRPLRPEVRVVAVDALSSRASGPAVTGRRLLPGIGSSRRSVFLRPHSFDYAVRVADADAIAMCRILLADTGISIGGSSGAVLYACLRDLERPDPARHPLCLCADGGAAYADTIHDDAWLAGADLLDEVRHAVRRHRVAGVHFTSMAPHPTPM
ncbi:MAG: pyridoxal-phosphate dependent enzyme [Micromonosporaceae bacterium]